MSLLDRDEQQMVNVAMEDVYKLHAYLAPLSQHRLAREALRNLEHSLTLLTLLSFNVEKRHEESAPPALFRP